MEFLASRRLRFEGTKRFVTRNAPEKFRIFEKRTPVHSVTPYEGAIPRQGSVVRTFLCYKNVVLSNELTKVELPP